MNEQWSPQEFPDWTITLVAAFRVARPFFILHYPGVEGDIFVIQALYHNILEGRKSIYLTLSTDPQTFRKEFMSLGWNIKDHKEKFIVIDTYSALIGTISGEEYIVDNS